MTHRRTKPLTEKGSLGFNNTPSTLRPSIQNYRKGLDTFILQKELSVYTGRFAWEGLPEGLNENLIETMLYYKGQLAFFKTGSKYYILPFVYTGTMNHYGLPEKILPVPFNGKIENDKNVKGFINKPKGAILYNDPDHDELPIEDKAIILRERSGLMVGNTLPTIVLTNEIRDKLSENLVLLRNNLILSQPIKYVTADTQDKVQSLNTQFNHLMHDIIQGNIIQSIVGQVKLNDVISEPSKLQTNQLWQSYSSLDALRLEGLGILNNGTFEKSERVLLGEIAGKQSESKLVLEDNLNQRKVFCELVNKHFSLNISVRISDSMEIDDDIDLEDGRVGGHGEVFVEDDDK